jgi:hypothetical protein
MNDVYLFSLNDDRNRASGNKRVKGVYGCRESPLVDTVGE